MAHCWAHQWHKYDVTSLQMIYYAAGEFSRLRKAEKVAVVIILIHTYKLTMESRQGHT